MVKKKIVSVVVPEIGSRGPQNLDEAVAASAGGKVVMFGCIRCVNEMVEDGGFHSLARARSLVGFREREAEEMRRMGITFAR